MRMLLFIATLATLQLLIDASHPYYYFGQPNYYHHAAPVPDYNSFSHNSYSHPYTSTFFGNPNFLYRTVPAPIIPQFRIPVPTTSAPIIHHHAPQNQDYSQSHQDGEYRGFAYQTRTDQGATSHVLFVTGPQSEMFKSAILPPKMQNPMMNENQNEVNKAKNIASNMVDAVGRKVPQTNFYNSGPQPVPQDPTQFFQDFLQQNQIPRTVHFYSRNSKLFAQPAISYPASTGPLLQPIESGYYSPLTNLRCSPCATTETPMMTTTKFEEKSDNEDAQESIISQTRFRLNQITENPREFTPQTTEEITASNFDIETLPFGARLSARFGENVGQKAIETTEETKTTVSSLETQSTEASTQAIIETTVVNTPKIEPAIMARNFPVIETTVRNVPTTIADSLTSETTIANSRVSETTSTAANTPTMETISSTVASETTVPVETTTASRTEATVANSPAIEKTTAAILDNSAENETTIGTNANSSKTETLSTEGGIPTEEITENTANTREELTDTPFTSAVTMTTSETEDATTKMQ